MPGPLTARREAGCVCVHSLGIKPGGPQTTGNPVNFNQCHFKSCAHLEILSANVVSCVIEVKNKFKAIPLDFFGISFALDYSTIFIFSVGAYIHM